jgi:hypothetical protein
LEWGRQTALPFQFGHGAQSSIDEVSVIRLFPVEHGWYKDPQGLHQATSRLNRDLSGEMVGYHQYGHGMTADDAQFGPKHKLHVSFDVDLGGRIETEAQCGVQLERAFMQALFTWDMRRKTSTYRRLGQDGMGRYTLVMAKTFPPRLEGSVYCSYPYPSDDL